MHVNQCRSLLLATLLALPMCSMAQWVASGRDATFTMYLPRAKKPDTRALFIVSYERRWSCKPAVSVILMSGRKLGAAENQSTERKRDEQLSIEIDGKKFTGETKVTMYSNAMELAMVAPPGLVQALSGQPSSILARLGAGMGGFDFSDGTGFVAANAAAAASCS